MQNEKNHTVHHRLFVPTQAVSGPVGHNPISILIPCHRVVERSGSLTGYTGRLEQKARLLAPEVDTSAFFFPEKGTARQTAPCSASRRFSGSG